MFEARPIPPKSKDIVRVLLVDDHPLVRDGLAGLLNNQAEYEVVGQAANAAEGVEMFHQLHPQLVIVDLRLPDGDGAKIFAMIPEMRWSAYMIVLSAFRSDDDIVAAARAGAAAYLVKTAPASQILETISRVLQGESPLQTELSMSLRSKFAEKDLSAKEASILGLLGDGLTNKEISRVTKLSENTVKSHLRRIFQKINVSNRAEATAVALRRGLMKAIR